MSNTLVGSVVPFRVMDTAFAGFTSQAVSIDHSNMNALLEAVDIETKPPTKAKRSATPTPALLNDEEQYCFGKFVRSNLAFFHIKPQFVSSAGNAEKQIPAISDDVLIPLAFLAACLPSPRMYVAFLGELVHNGVNDEIPGRLYHRFSFALPGSRLRGADGKTNAERTGAPANNGQVLGRVTVKTKETAGQNEGASRGNIRDPIADVIHSMVRPFALVDDRKSFAMVTRTDARIILRKIHKELLPLTVCSAEELATLTDMIIELSAPDAAFVPTNPHRSAYMPSTVPLNDTLTRQIQSLKPGHQEGQRILCFPEGDAGSWVVDSKNVKKPIHIRGWDLLKTAYLHVLSFPMVAYSLSAVSFDRARKEMAQSIQRGESKAVDPLRVPKRPREEEVKLARPDKDDHDEDGSGESVSGSSIDDDDIDDMDAPYLRPPPSTKKPETEAARAAAASPQRSAADTSDGVSAMDTTMTTEDPSDQMLQLALRQIKTLKADKQRAENKLKQLRRANAALNQQLDEAKRQLNAGSKAEVQVPDERKAKVDQLTEALQQKELHCRKLEGDFQDLRRQFSGLQTEHSGQTFVLNTFKKRVEELVQEKNQFKEKFELAVPKEEVEKLKSEWANEKKDLVDKLQEQRKEVDSLTLQLQTARESEVAKEMAALEAQVKNFAEEKNKLAMQVRCLLDEKRGMDDVFHQTNLKLELAEKALAEEKAESQRLREWRSKMLQMVNKDPVS